LIPNPVQYPVCGIFSICLKSTNQNRCIPQALKGRKLLWLSGFQPSMDIGGRYAEPRKKPKVAKK
jgi:hypothetical protein